MQKASRIELHSLSQRVRIKLLVGFTQALKTQEQGYLLRHYFPRADMQMDLLTVSETTDCPFKSEKVYFSLWGFRIFLGIMSSELRIWRL